MWSYFFFLQNSHLPLCSFNYYSVASMQKRENNDIKNEVIIAFSSTSDSDNAFCNNQCFLDRLWFWWSFCCLTGLMVGIRWPFRSICMPFAPTFCSLWTLTRREKGRTRNTASTRGEWPSSHQILDKCDQYLLQWYLNGKWCCV